MKYCECELLKICGEAFTPYICKRCKIKKINENTCIPKYCAKCALILKVCPDCGLPKKSLI